jgi:hypothetical protein
MLRIRTCAVWFLIVAVTALLVVWVVGSSESFQACVNKYEHQEGAERAQNEESGLFVFVGVLGKCLGGFVNVNDNAIIAVATLLLMIITGALGYFGYVQTSTLRTQSRAYVLPDQLAVTDGTTVGQQQHAGEPGVILLIRNFGQTPGREVVSWADIRVEYVRFENTLTVPAVTKFGAATIGKGGHIRKFVQLGRKLNASEIGDIATGARAIYIYGRIEYRDVFGRPHYTNFRHRYIGAYPPSGSGGTMYLCEKGNESD